MKTLVSITLMSLLSFSSGSAQEDKPASPFADPKFQTAAQRRADELKKEVIESLAKQDDRGGDRWRKFLSLKIKQRAELAKAGGFKIEPAKSKPLQFRSCGVEEAPSALNRQVKVLRGYCELSTGFVSQIYGGNTCSYWAANKGRSQTELLEASAAAGRPAGSGYSPTVTKAEIFVRVYSVYVVTAEGQIETEPREGFPNYSPTYPAHPSIEFKPELFNWELGSWEGC